MARGELTPLIDHVSGRLGAFVIRKKGEKTVFAKPARRTGKRQATENQEKSENAFSQAVRAWTTLTAGERGSWQEYARSHCRDCPHRQSVPSGYNVFTGAACLNLQAGREMARTAPATPPPPAVRAIHVAGFEEERTLEITFEHWLADTQDCLLSVQITPAMPQGYAPLPRRLRAVKGAGPDSFFALGASPQTVRFENLPSRYTEETQFLLRVMIVDPSGVASEPFMAVGVHGEAGSVWKG